jgi:hypothetical protein
LEQEELKKIMESKETTPEQKKQIENLISFYSTLSTNERSFIRSQLPLLIDSEFSFSVNEKQSLQEIVKICGVGNTLFFIFVLILFYLFCLS